MHRETDEEWGERTLREKWEKLIKGNKGFTHRGRRKRERLREQKRGWKEKGRRAGEGKKEVRGVERKREKREREWEEDRESGRDHPEHHAMLVSRSFTYFNSFRLVLVLRALPRAHAPSLPMLLLLRLWQEWLKERGGGMERGFEMREERREGKEAESKSGIKEWESEGKDQRKRYKTE